MHFQEIIKNRRTDQWKGKKCCDRSVGSKTLHMHIMKDQLADRLRTNGLNNRQTESKGSFNSDNQSVEDTRIFR